MTMKSALFGAGASSIGLLMIASGALAEESVSVLGTTAAQNCADAAAVATRGGATTSTGIAQCTTAVGQDSTPHSELAATYLNRGVLYMARGDYRDAIADDDAAIRTESGLAEAYSNRGAASAALHHPADASADFTQALALNPKTPETIYFNRAMAREDLGDLKGAYLDYRKAAELAPGWEMPKQQLARFTVGHANQS